MIDPVSMAAFAAQLLRLITQWMTVNGTPVTRDERWAMARRLHSRVEAERLRVYNETVAQLREQAPGIRPAPLEPYRLVALVSAIERATGAEPPPNLRRARTDRAEQAAAAQPESAPTEGQRESQPQQRREPTSRVRVTGGQQARRSRVTVVAPADLDPQSRRESRSRVVVTAANRRDPAVVREVAARASATVERHVRQADRETIIATADRAGEEIGWARVLSGAENCPWCAMLASRGPVYRSDKSALSVVGGRRGQTRGSRDLGEAYHDNCDCDAVLVREGEDWAGREEFERLQRMWTAATAVHPRDATRAFNRSWRRIQRHPELEDAYNTLWAEATEGLEGSAALRAFASAARNNPPAALDPGRRRPEGGEEAPPADPENPQPGPDDTDPPSLPPDNGAATPAPDEDPFEGLIYPHPWTVRQNLDGLSREQRAEIANYAVGGYHAVNDTLRGRRPSTPDIDERIELLRTAMEANPLQQSYRVTRTAEIVDLDLGDQRIDESLVGKALTERAFMSTSGHRQPPYLMKRVDPVVLELIVPEGTPAIAIDDNLTTLSMVERERELLLIDGLSFVVLSVGTIDYDEKPGVPLIRAMILPTRRGVNR